MRFPSVTQLKQFTLVLIACLASFLGGMRVDADSAEVHGDGNHIAFGPVCSAGFEMYISQDAENTVVSCENADYIVYLGTDGKFSQAFDKTTSPWRIIEDPAQVEGW